MVFRHAEYEHLFCADVDTIASQHFFPKHATLFHQFSVASKAVRFIRKVALVVESYSDMRERSKWNKD